MTEGLKTLDAITAQAEAAGYGSSKLLRRRFADYQQVGLLGPPVRKESRRGGAGLWHPAQAALFDLYLRHRRNGFNLTTLANVPIAFWMLRHDGIETAQVQRALLFAASGILPDEWERDGRSIRRPPAYGRSGKRGRDQRGRGDRSDLGQSAQRAVDGVVFPGAPFGAKRDLLQSLRRVTERLPESLTLNPPAVDRTTFTTDFLRARTDTPANRAAAAAIYQMLSDRLLGLSYLDVLTVERGQVIDYWLWARSFWQLSFIDYLNDRPRLQGIASVGDLFSDPTDDDILSSSAGWLLAIFGGGIRWLRGDYGPGVDQSPPDPSLSRLFCKT